MIEHLTVLVLPKFLSMVLLLADLLLVHTTLQLLLRACAPALSPPFMAIFKMSSFSDICLQNQSQPH